MAISTMTETRTQDIQLTDSERTPCEIWTRVMGYYRPLTYMNPGKQSENDDRLLFKEPPACVLEATGQMKLGL
jgi:anaerobic ribonucleoside-triphosphate reductase